MSLVKDEVQDLKFLKERGAVMCEMSRQVYVPAYRLGRQKALRSGKG